jgi:hypothetical protein
MPAAKHTCYQVESLVSNSKDIEALQNYRKEDMAIIQEVRDDVKDIKKYLTEELPNKYATKEEVAILRKNIIDKTQEEVSTKNEWIKTN